ncbi:hypothetical protein GCM10009541_37920 [Micromonospora gifhornensis]|uniref:Uncharacterized protein n=1 Tax=Micromonospora gifhornensis TaxID=84594 RepID=A0ABQ4IH49_9ACTN|nr:hypothetical protein Vgi01_38340 [Micromonospora gifhornensis]
MVNRALTATRRTDRSGARLSSSAAITAATAADLSYGEDTTGRYGLVSPRATLALGRADPPRQGIVADGVFVP